MHHAPSVIYPVGRSRVAAAVLAGLWVIGATTLALWTFQAHTPGWRHALAWLFLAGTGLWAGSTWRRTPAAVLQWNSQAWSWLADDGNAEVEGSVTVGLDMQRVLLLRWQGSGLGDSPVRWLWLERSSRAGLWDDLRRAVYSRAIPEAPPQAKPPVAKP